LQYGRYLGDVEKIKAAAEAVKNQTKVWGWEVMGNTTIWGDPPLWIVVKLQYFPVSLLAEIALNLLKSFWCVPKYEGT
jgi:hypothetical protein